MLNKLFSLFFHSIAIQFGQIHRLYVSGNKWRRESQDRILTLLFVSNVHKFFPFSLYHSRIYLTFLSFFILMAVSTFHLIEILWQIFVEMHIRKTFLLSKRLKNCLNTFIWRMRQYNFSLNKGLVLIKTLKNCYELVSYFKLKEIASFIKKIILNCITCVGLSDRNGSK